MNCELILNHIRGLRAYKDFDDGECDGDEVNCEVVLNHIRNLRTYKDFDDWNVKGVDGEFGGS